MGYQTDFTGEFTVTPPLNEHEIAYLRDFATTRRMDREEGPYFAKNDGDFGQNQTPGIRNYNGPPAGQPGLWCQWVPSDDGSRIEWDMGEKFYHADDWIIYIIDHFLKPAAVAACNLSDAVKQDARIRHFTFDHVVSGEVFAQGEDSDDVWKMVATNNSVKVHQGKITYEA